MHKAVFFDKDGTLIENVPYNVDPEKIKFYPDAPKAVASLKQNGFKIVVISNQAGVAYGYFEETALEKLIDTLQQVLDGHDVQLDGFYYCPHHTSGKVADYTIDCDCRKPKPGMILKAAKELNIDLSQSWMVGDILHDVEAGNTAGCRTILIDNGNETEWITDGDRKPDYVVKKVEEAALKILEHDKQFQANGDDYERPTQKSD